MADNVLGLDVSHHRKDVPLRTAKQQGVRFLIAKCTEGTEWVDETYEGYKLEAKNKSLPFGGFMYWRVYWDAAEQAAHYVKSLGTTEFPGIVDVERYLNTIYGTNTPLKPISTNRMHLRVVLNEIERRMDRKPMIYTNFASWRCLMRDAAWINEYECWVANYGRLEPYLPVPLKEWKIWQFTSTYKVSGYSRGLDGNWFNGNEGDFEKWLAEMQGTEPPPDDGLKGIFMELDGDKWEGLVRKVN